MSVGSLFRPRLPRSARFTRTRFAVLLLAVASASAACDSMPLAPELEPAFNKGKGNAAVKQHKVTVTPDPVTLKGVGASVTLKATVVDDKGRTVSNPPITWSSLAPEIASVNASGIVTSLSAGLALITAISGTAADTATVEVHVAASVATSPASASMVAGDTLRLRARALDGSGKELTGVSLLWSSSDPLVATVSSDGLVRAVAAGSATVRATSGSVHGSTALTVTAPAALPVGPSTWIYPGEDIQKKVSASPAGTAFLLKAGVHRMQQITPRDGQQFVGEPGAVLNGARLLTSFTREGGFWVAGNQTQQGQVHGSCRKEADGSRYEGCVFPEDLFINDRMLWQVTSLAEVRPGSWYFDYAADKVYFADDPTGRKVEISVTRHAFTGGASGVTIRGLTVEKYANPAQHGAIHGRDSRGWIVTDNIIQHNHGVGLRVGERMQVRNNRILRNGQMGIGGSGDDVLVEGNEIAHNHTGGFNIGWEAGGSKFVRTHRLIVRGNHVHNNDGPGLWTDIDNIHTLYEKNRVEDNTHAGIFHEISYDAVIRDNIVRRNGLAYNAWLWGAGILVAGSSNVEIHGNLVEENGNGITGVQQNRGTGAYGPWKLRNLRVHNNTIRMLTIGRSGVARDDGDPAVYEAAGNNRFDHNSYVVGRHRQTWFMFNHGNRTWTDWRNLGQDPNGVLVVQ